jgi:hypothetical protein
MHLCSPRNAERDIRKKPNVDGLMLDYIIKKQSARQSYGRNLTNYRANGEPHPLIFSDGMLIGGQAVATFISLPDDTQPFSAASMYINNVGIEVFHKCPDLADADVNQAFIYKNGLRAVTRAGLKPFLRSDEYGIGSTCVDFDGDLLQEDGPWLENFRRLRSAALLTIVHAYWNKVTRHDVNRLAAAYRRVIY